MCGARPHLSYLEKQLGGRFKMGLVSFPELMLITTDVELQSPCAAGDIDRRQPRQGQQPEAVTWAQGPMSHGAPLGLGGEDCSLA